MTKVQSVRKEIFWNKTKTICLANIDFVHSKIIVFVFTLNSQISIDQTIGNFNCYFGGKKRSTTHSIFQLHTKKLLTTNKLLMYHWRLNALNCSNYSDKV